MSAAGTVAISSTGVDCVAGTNVVANWVVPAPFVHCTPEQGRRFEPVTIKVAPEAPAVAPAGEIDAIVAAGGVAAVIVNGVVLDNVPELDT